jgi:hypothetical protein
MHLAVAANVVLKLALLPAVAVMLVFPDLPQFEGKSLTLRAILYPIFAIAPYAVYRLKRMHGPYPTVVDLCWTWIFTLDIVSNDLNWYNAYTWWDDLIHFVNALPYMAVLTAALLALEERGVIRLGFWGAMLVAFSAFTAFHAVWEMWEHLMDRFLQTQLQPGGMAEATENNLAGMAGGLLAIVVLRRLAGAFHRRAILPLAAYVAQLRPPRGSEDRQEERVLQRGVQLRPLA